MRGLAAERPTRTAAVRRQPPNEVNISERSKERDLINWSPVFII